jgi:hypothetical protein
MGWAVGAPWPGSRAVVVAGVGCSVVVVGLAGAAVVALVRRGRRGFAAALGAAGSYLGCLLGGLVAVAPSLAVTGADGYALDVRRWLLLEPWFLSRPPRRPDGTTRWAPTRCTCPPCWPAVRCSSSSTW